MRIYSNKISEENKKNKVGEKNITNQGFEITLVEYKSYRDCIVEFNDRYHTRKSFSYLNFQRGNIRNPSCWVLYKRGIAYREDVKGNEKAFEKYRAMFDRCYGKQEGNNAVYKGCEVCNEWYDFSAFAKWYDENFYQINDEKMDLDKDLFGDGKLYSPNTCIFIPHKLNSQFANHEKKNKTLSLPLGVTLHKREGGSVCYRVIALDKNQLFDSIDEASNAYNNYIHNNNVEFANKYKDIIPQKLYDFLMRA